MYSTLKPRNVVGYFRASERWIVVALFVSFFVRSFVRSVVRSFVRSFV